MHVRWMIKRDYSEVLDIDFLYYPRSWKTENFDNFWKKEKTGAGYITEFNEIITGYALYYTHKDCLYVKRLAYHLNYPQAVEYLIEKIIRLTKKKEIVFCIDESDLRTHLYLKEIGAKAVKIKKDRYIFRLTLKNHGLAHV